MMRTTIWRLRRLFAAAAVLTGATALALAQVSASAYRVLGQPNFRQNALNMVNGTELRGPAGVAIDARGGQIRLYISDTQNSRILGWGDASAYQAGDAPAIVLGQPGLQQTNVLGIGVKGLNNPWGLAVDPANGNLYVADSGNNRVLRFPSPFSNPGRVEPDAMYGQPDFNGRTAGVSRGAMNRPRAVAFDGSGNLWVADTGNHRVLRFAASTLDNINPPEADAVIGQKDFISGTANHGGQISAIGFDQPSGIAFDAQNNLYVSDTNNARVLTFSAPFGPGALNPSATGVLGQPDFKSRDVPPQATASTISSPMGISIDAAGKLYVAVANDNRVLVFSPAAASAGYVLGQPDFSSTAANVTVFPTASANTLSGCMDVKADAAGNAYVADTGNHRVLAIPAGSKTAAKVWGQSDFTSNGANQIKPGSIATPYKIAVDYSQKPFVLYVSDLENHRVLGWRDAVRFRNGDPADFVIGQPDLRTALPNTDSRGSRNPTRNGLDVPAGIVVDQRDGTLYVADAVNNRVLRFPRPADQTDRITPDVVLGQTDFNNALSAAVGSSSLRVPTGLALGPDGNLFVADSGNNRVLEFAYGSGTGAAAIRVYGQPGFNSSSSPMQVSAQTLSAPQGVYVDSAANLYVADTGANRVVIFPNTQSAPVAGTAAAFVIGQDRFDTAAAGSLSQPADVTIDSYADIYVSDSGHNRVLTFPSLLFLPLSGATATSVVGQKTVSGTAPNWNSTDGQATAEGIFVPQGIYLDRQDTIYVADAGNNRVLHFLKPVSVVSAATAQAGTPVAQGALANLLGNELAAQSASVSQAAWPPLPGGVADASGVTWPSSMAGRELAINDEIPAAIYAISPSQVNFQMPSAAPAGAARVAVRMADTGELIAGGSILIASSAPGLFAVTGDGKGQGMVINDNGHVNDSSNTASRGSVITLYGTGQGQVSPAAPDGIPAASGIFTVAIPTADARACIATQPSLCVAFGTGLAEVQSSGLAPGFVGVWQLKIKVPVDAPLNNAVPVAVLINGARSNTVTVAVR